MKILLINDNSAHVNWGAQATIFALRRMLADEIEALQMESISHAWLRRLYREAALPAGKTLSYWEGQFGGIKERILNRISGAAEYYPVVFDDFDHYADEWMAGRAGPDAAAFLAAATVADAVVYNGENSIYRNTLEGCRALFLLWLARTRLGRPSAIINHTAHLDDVQPRMPTMVSHVFPLLNVVTCREPRAWEQIRGMGISHAELVPDAVFYLGSQSPAEGSVREWRGRAGLDGRPYFCLSGSALPASEPRGMWDGRVAELVRGLKAGGFVPVLVAKDPECLFLEEVARRTGGVFFGPEHSFHELWPLFREAAFLVSGHYHYVIIGALVGCPFIPLSVNNGKMKGACLHLEWQRTEPFDITDLGSCSSAILAEARRLVKDRENLSASLGRRAELLRRDAGRNARFVRRMVEEAKSGQGGAGAGR